MEKTAPSLLWIPCTFGLTVLLGTEFLSAIGFLDRYGIFCLWATYSSLLLFFLRKRERIRFPGELVSWSGLLLLIFALGVLASALLCAPNNWDSMVYHLPRVMHWASQRSVAIYPTAITFQVTNPPFAEYFLLHLFLLTKNDCVLFLAQFLAWIGSGHLLWALCRWRRTDPLTALLLWTSIPMGILQASTTQNDLVAAYWALHLLLALLIADGTTQRHQWVLVGLSLGLLLSTKGTSYIYAGALSLAFFARNPGANARRLFLAGAIGLLVNSPFYIRELLVFGHPLPTGGEETVFIKNLSGSGILSNLVKNLALHLNGPFPFGNQLASSFVSWTHQWIGLSPADPAFTLGRSGFSLPPPFLYEDFDGNTLFFLLAILLSPLLLFRRNRQRAGFFFLLFGLSFLFLCALKWSSWHSRYHLTAFLLLVPGMASLKEQLLGRHWSRLVASVLCLASLPYVFTNRMKPLISIDSMPAVYELTPKQQLFSQRPALFTDYMTLIEQLNRTDCREIGISANSNTLEYPLWALLDFPQKPLRIVHEQVLNPTARKRTLEGEAPLCAHVDLRGMQ